MTTCQICRLVGCACCITGFHVWGMGCEGGAVQDFAVLRAMRNATEVEPVIGDICEAAAWEELQERWRL